MKSFIVTHGLIAILNLFALIAFPHFAAASGQEFIFPDEYGCQEVPGISLKFCDGKDIGRNSAEEGLPLRWNQEDIQLMVKKIAPLEKSGKLKQFFARLEATGFNKLYRYKYGFFGDSEGNFQRVPTAMMVTDHRRGIIQVTDRFLSYDIMDPISSFSRADLSMLHELLHAFDGGSMKYSRDESFLRVAGWRRVENRWRLQSPPEQFAELMARFNDFLMQKDYVQAFKLSRETSIKYNLASFAVVANPAEYFAETAATIYFDPKASTYIPLPVQKWFKENVLK